MGIWCESLPWATGPVSPDWLAPNMARKENNVSPTEELIHAVKRLRHALGPEGEYAIHLSNGKPIGWGEFMLMGTLLEAVDKALIRAEDSERR